MPARSFVPTAVVTIVVDASAAAAVVFREPDALLVTPHLLRATRLVVPDLFFLELANVARTKIHRGELLRRHAMTLLRTVEAWPTVLAAISWQSALHLALDQGLAVYDAVSLRIARDRKLPLLTLDRDLARAAGRLARPGLG
jgi:predicted nucleic acid-binding protein